VVEVNHEIADTVSALNAALAEKRMEDTTDVNPAWQGVNSSLVEGGIERQALIAQGESVQRSLADLRGRLARLQSLDVHFNGLQEQADQARSNFELFSEKRDQAQIEDAMDERELINIAEAESPGDQSAGALRSQPSTPASTTPRQAGRRAGAGRIGLGR